MEIKDILEPSEYESLNQFTPDDIEWINGRINTRRNGEPGIECVVRGKNNDGDYFKLTPFFRRTSSYCGQNNRY